MLRSITALVALVLLVTPLRAHAADAANPNPTKRI
jgi:hypothetical protein